MPCEFMTNLGANPTDESLSRALAKAILEIQEKAVSSMKMHCMSLMIKYPKDVPDSEIDRIFSLHRSDMLYEVGRLFDGEEEIKSRVSAVLNDPTIIGMDSDTFDGFFHNGFIYAIYWYGITGSEPDWGVCSSINHLHGEMIEAMLKDANNVVYGNNKSVAQNRNNAKNSSWPYWIAMLVIGLIIGTIISASR